MMKRLRSRADVYRRIVAVINYMVFDEVSFVLPQIKMVKDEIRKLIKEQDNKTYEVQS